MALCVDLVIPGLMDIEPPADWQEVGFDVWRTLLRQGSRLEERRPADELLANLLGFEKLAATMNLEAASFSYAELRWLGDFGTAWPSTTSTRLLCADPLWLLADKDSVLVQDAHSLALTDEECTAIQKAFNQHFSADGVSLIALSPQQGYLQCSNQAPLPTRPLQEILYRNLDHFFPEGIEQRHWRALLNEIQMLFHHLPMNAQREKNGQAPINGLWLWGDQKFLARQKPNYAKVISDHGCDQGCDDGFVRGCALHWKIPVEVMKPTTAPWQGSLLEPSKADASIFVLLQALQPPAAAQDSDAWCQAWITSISQPMSSLHQQLRLGTVTSCRIFPFSFSSLRGISIKLSKWDLWKFWK